MSCIYNVPYQRARSGVGLGREAVGAVDRYWTLSRFDPRQLHHTRGFDCVPAIPLLMGLFPLLCRCRCRYAASPDPRVRKYLPYVLQLWGSLRDKNMYVSTSRLISYISILDITRSLLLLQLLLPTKTLLPLQSTRHSRSPLVGTSRLSLAESTKACWGHES
jgi:hypothetical protein